MGDKQNRVEPDKPVDMSDASGGADGRYGKAHKYEPNFKGPITSRSCTDILCLMIFILYFIGMIAVAIIALISGDPRRLVYPTDSNGTICGIDEPDKEFLVFFDLSRCSATSLSCETPQVCVEKCPDKYWFNPNLGDWSLEDLNLTAADLGSPICVNGVDQSAENFNLTQALLDNKCAPYVLNSTDVFNRCVPALVFDSNISEAFVTAVIDILIDTVAATTPIDREDIQEAIDFVLSFGGGTLVIIEDIQSSWNVILVGICIGTVLCFIWCFIMRYIAGYMVWGSILLLNCLLGAATALCFWEYNAIREDETRVTEDFEFTLDINYYLRLEKTWLIAGCVCGGLFLILLLLTCCLCNRIRIAIALIEEASRSVTAFWSTLFWPLIPFVLEVFVIALWCVIALYLGTASEDTYTLNNLAGLIPENTTDDIQTVVCGKGSSLTEFNISKDITDAFCTFNTTYTVEFRYLQVYNLFGFLWLLNFIIGFSHLTLAGVFSKYYWTFDKKNVPTTALGGALWVTVRYHLGSVAFGAAIIAIIQLIRIILEYLEVQLKKGKDNPIVGYTLKCLKCLFWCLEKFMKFINKNAYIMVAIYGRNFCRSAKKAFFLLMRNIVRVAVVNKITDFLLFLGALMVTAAIVLISFFFYAFAQDYAITAFVSDSIIRVPEVRYYWIIIILIGIGTFVVAKLFFGVFDMAVDTLFLCFLEDLERNDGSAEKPYFMNKNLLNICGKKNRFSSEEEW